MLSFYQFLILCSPLFIVDFVSVECFTYDIKFYFQLHEFEILKHRKSRYPNFLSLTDVTISDLVSKALDDETISDEEFSLVLSELNKFFDKQEKVQLEAKSSEGSLINRI